MAEQVLLCPSCGKKFKPRSYDAGKTYKCPQCSGKLQPTSQADASAKTIVTDGLDAQNAVDPLIGTQVGQYKILDKLGEGGMGAVYKAEHVKLRRLSALKILPEHMVERSPAAVKRFMREARSAAALSHPNIVTVYNVDEADGHHFIDMELVNGESVQDRLRRDGRFDLAEATRIVIGTARALGAAHEKHIVHRDVKPANILLGGNGTVKVADFGLAKNVEDDSMLTGQGQIGMGTAHFMSPEQCDGEDVDGRTDIYSLGATYYYLLTGNPPFDSTSRLSIMVKHKTEPVPDPRSIVPDLPEAVSAIVQKAMAKVPADRYQSCAELIDELDRVATHATEGVPTRLRRFPRSPAALLATAAGVILVACAGAWLLGHERRPGPEIPPPTSTTPVPRPTQTDKLYVSPIGSDAWTGRTAQHDARSLKGPLASLEAARDSIRAMRQGPGLPQGGVTVHIQGGTHLRTASFELTAQDSGTEEAPIIYRACEGEVPRLLGGIQVTGFGPIDDPAILRQIDTASRDKIMQADLALLGIAELDDLPDASPGGGRFCELFFNGQRMQLARWPNKGWATVARVVDRGSTPRSGETENRGGTFVYEGDRPRRWQVEHGVWLNGYWCHDWWDECLKVKSIDVARKRITFAAAHRYGIGASLKWNKEPRRYYALNLLAELDAPGEYYIDCRARRLYFWPPTDLSQGETVLSLLKEPMVSLTDASHVTIQGLTFEAARGDAMTMSGGTRNLITACAFRNLAGNAVIIKGGSQNGVTGCSIQHMGEGGIVLEGGDRKTLTPGCHFAQNNHIHHYARRQKTYAAAVDLVGVGNRATHNLIHDAPIMAIKFNGNDHVIELNEIHHICSETSDAGAVYCCARDWTSRGNVIRHNFIHHIVGPDGPHAMAVYLDDYTSGTAILGNVLHKAGRGVHIRGGRDNTIANNIFASCGTSVTIVTARPKPGAQTVTQMREKLSRIRYAQPPYSTRYPKLASTLKDDPFSPKGNVIARNVSHGGEWLKVTPFGDRVMVETKDNLTDRDPLFVDPANGDFQLTEGSPAYDLGFQRIPMEKIGLLDAGRTAPARPSQSRGPSRQAAQAPAELPRREVGAATAAASAKAGRWIEDIAWTVGPDMPGSGEGPCEGSAVGVLNGSLVCAGGDWPTSARSATYAFNLSTLTWARLPDIPTWRRNLRTIVHGGCLYAVGGVRQGATWPEVFRLSASMGQWRWETFASLEPDRAWAAVGIAGSRILIAGGMRRETGRRRYDPALMLRRVEFLDVERSQGGWQPLPDIPERPRANAAGAVVGASFYLFGGYDLVPAVRRLSETLCLDLTARQWTRKRSLPFAVAGARAVVVDDRHVILLGGVGDAATPEEHEGSDSVLVYDAMEDTFRQLPTRLPYPAFGIGATVQGDSLYVAGGFLKSKVRCLRIGQIQWSGGTQRLAGADSQPIGATTTGAHVPALSGIAKSFFAIGVYAGTPEWSPKEMEEAGFNFAICPASAIDKVARSTQAMKVCAVLPTSHKHPRIKAGDYSGISPVLTSYRGHSRLLGWYMDEPGVWKVPLPNCMQIR